MAVLTAWHVSLFRPNKPSLLPPLYEGEALACRVLDVNPSGVRFLQPVYLELPHFSCAERWRKRVGGATNPGRGMELAGSLC